MCRNVGGVMKTGVTAVLDGQLFVGEGKLARVNEEKGKELGANLDEIRAHCPSRQPHQNLPANQRRRESQELFLFSGSRAEPVPDIGSSFGGQAGC
jgi:hypothetical protein